MPNTPDPQAAEERRERYATAISKWHRDPERPLYAQGADAVIAVADAEQAELRERLADYENRITWETTCGSCARILDSSIRETEQTEAHRLALSEALGLGTGAPWDAIREQAAVVPSAAETTNRATSDAVREQLLAALDFAYCQGLGYDTPEALLAAYDATQPVPPPADRATLRDRIADTVMPFLLNFSDEESARINAAEVATALLADVPAPAPVCICGHSKQQHFEDACITEITGCNCGDYLEPQDAAEVIDRWRQAALQARAADRAALLDEVATALIGRHCSPESVAIVRRLVNERLCTACQAYGQTVEDKPDGGIVRRCKDCSGEGLRRVAAEEQPTETQDSLPAWLYQRFMPDGEGWENLDADDRSYWEHHARAVRRAVARDGFKAEQPAAVEQPDTQTREARVGRCSAVMLRVHHAPHGWEPQPGMEPVHCPGYPQPGKES
ncbi:hypothetical protein QA802_07725 [Streptomyces sp. B21-105]|uniref:hypothetical protein n=1 Tax=Streptomyces sp. B21-105 TaxID=3039417 RepID=UPI002FF10F2C